MKVLKFGGTSVGSAARIKEVAKLVTKRGKNIIVLSAMSGTTNTLVEISDYLHKRNVDGAKEIVNQLENKYRNVIDELFASDEYREAARKEIKAIFNYIRSLSTDKFSYFEEREILAQGELISTNLLNLYLHEQSVDSVLLSALEFMRTDNNGEPDSSYIRSRLHAQLEKHSDAAIYLTQGYICRNAFGEVDNLQRGGSDYTASLIG
ncbi:MAG: aspartate kinase, partial [Muribaculaceae bacterium]|nr:aspartate kinase [Muribaculaceae bacterium]